VTDYVGTGLRHGGRRHPGGTVVERIRRPEEDAEIAGTAATCLEGIVAEVDGARRAACGGVIINIVAMATAADVGRFTAAEGLAGGRQGCGYGQPGLDIVDMLGVRAPAFIGGESVSGTGTPGAAAPDAAGIGCADGIIIVTAAAGLAGINLPVDMQGTVCSGRKGSVQIDIGVTAVADAKALSHVGRVNRPGCPGCRWRAMADRAVCHRRSGVATSEGGLVPENTGGNGRPVGAGGVALWHGRPMAVDVLAGAGAAKGVVGRGPVLAGGRGVGKGHFRGPAAQVIVIGGVDRHPVALDAADRGDVGAAQAPQMLLMGADLDVFCRAG